MPTITGIAYADLLVRPATADRWLTVWQALGFELAGTLHTPDAEAYTLRRPGGAQLIVSVARPGGTADLDVDKYGEGVRDLALFTTDVTGTFEAMTAAGAAPIFETGWTLLGSKIAVAGGVGRLRHTLLEAPSPLTRTAGWDHAAIVVPAGELDGAARFYQHAGLDWAPAEPAGTGRDGMISGVLTGGTAALTLAAPNPRSGSMEAFLAVNAGGAAVRHLALPTRNVAALVDEVDTRAGIRWVATPPGWAQNLAGRPDLAVLTGRGVLAGRDPEGRVLRQCFTTPLVPACGLFAEVIQRRDRAGSAPAGGFGWDSTDQLQATDPHWSPV